MKNNSLNSYACVYAHYNAYERVNNYAIEFLKALSVLNFRIIFVSNSILVSSAVEKLLSQIPGIEITQRKNKGRDFGAWKWAIDTQKIPKDATHILLANDTMLGPLFDIGRLIESMELKGHDFWGITESNSKGWHVQKYFMMFSRNVFRSAAFQKIFGQDFNAMSENDIFIKGEVGLSHALREHGFRCGSYVPNERLFILDPVIGDEEPLFLLWNQLFTKFKLPFVPKALIIENSDNLSNGGLRAIDLIRKHSLYDLNHISELIISSANNLNVQKENEVLQVICHLYYPHTIFSFLTKLANLKSYQSKFIFNLSSPLYLDPFLVSLLKKMFPGAIVLYSSQRGRDIGGKLAALDVFLKYKLASDYTLLIHDKLSPHTILGNQWRDELLTNIDQNVVPKILRTFRHDKRVGLISAKKFIKNEFDPDQNKFTCTSNEILTRLIRNLALQIDDFNFAAGTIFWIRTRILMEFFSKNRPLEIRKTLEKGNVLDFENGTFVHAWERVLSMLPNAYGYKIKGL